ncbi:MAG: transposase [Candidatus Komeilibacteria bacterium]|nr:transposase [Candidatus Komeilibacteria bacterium]
MPQKRIFIEGGFYFITCRTLQQHKIFCSDFVIKLFLEVLDYCRSKLHFVLLAFVVLPDHIHLLICPNERNTISDVIRHIKGRFARQYNLAVTEDEFLGYQKRNKQLTAVAEEFILGDQQEEFILGDQQQPEDNTIWQKSFYDRIICSEQQFENIVNYIDYNAVKHGLVKNPEDWLYSSYQNRYNTGKAIISID